MFGIDMPIIWLAITVVLAIVEGLTLGLTVIWFAFGALAAAIAAYMGANILIQLIVFIIMSAACVYFTRPIVKKFLKVGGVATNSDRTIGKSGHVIEAIDNENGVGQVKIGGLVWTARSEDGALIEVGARVLVNSIEGVKAIVIRDLD